MFKRSGFYFAAAFLLTAACAFGADAPTFKTAAPASIGVSLFRMVGSLAIVVAIFFAGAWLFKNGHRLRAQKGPQRKLHVIEAKSLAPRQALYVVGFDQQRMLIGSTPQGLTLITHLPDGEVPSDAERIVPVSFGEALMQALGRK